MYHIIRFLATYIFVSSAVVVPLSVECACLSVECACLSVECACLSVDVCMTGSETCISSARFWGQVQR